ncbi:MAG: hypothetical protein OXD32_05530 [Endozoicomonadaceae bacterium]|nr:hypothetical protein [Endozoicomonadaceae bacterium]
METFNSSNSSSKLHGFVQVADPANDRKDIPSSYIKQAKREESPVILNSSKIPISSKICSGKTEENITKTVRLLSDATTKEQAETAQNINAFTKFAEIISSVTQENKSEIITELKSIIDNQCSKRAEIMARDSAIVYLRKKGYSKEDITKLVGPKLDINQRLIFITINNPDLSPSIDYKISLPCRIVKNAKKIITKRLVNNDKLTDIGFNYLTNYTNIVNVLEKAKKEYKPLRALIEETRKISSKCKYKKDRLEKINQAKKNWAKELSPEDRKSFPKLQDQIDNNNLSPNVINEAIIEYIQNQPAFDWEPEHHIKIVKSGKDYFFNEGPSNSSGKRPSSQIDNKDSTQPKRSKLNSNSSTESTFATQIIQEKPRKELLSKNEQIIESSEFSQQGRETKVSYSNERSLPSGDTQELPLDLSTKPHLESSMDLPLDLSIKGTNTQQKH